MVLQDLCLSRLERAVVELLAQFPWRLAAVAVERVATLISELAQALPVQAEQLRS
jgi:hypothetical protein